MHTSACAGECVSVSVCMLGGAAGGGAQSRVSQGGHREGRCPPSVLQPRSPTSLAEARLCANDQRWAFHPSLVPGPCPSQLGDSAFSLNVLLGAPCIPQGCDCDRRAERRAHDE